MERRAMKVDKRIWNKVGGPGGGIWSICDTLASCTNEVRVASTLRWAARVQMELINVPLLG